MAERDGRAVGKGVTLAVVGLGTFMAALDGSVVNIALPLIQRDYGVPMATVTWVVTAYLLAISSLLLAFGRLGDIHGYRRLYAAGFAVFGAASLLCGLAPSLGWLVLARVVQGTGAAMLMAVGPALLTAAFPPGERGRALGLQATATYTALTVGPSLGGWIAGHLGWPWVFFVNLPVAAAGCLAARALPSDGQGSCQPFDLAGAALLAAGLVALLVALTRGEEWGWRSPAVEALLAAGALLLALFLLHEGRAPDPMLPLWLFRDPAFTGAVAAAFLQYTAVFMLLFLTPFYLQHLRGFTPQQAGALMTAQPALMVALAAASGWLSDRVGTRAPATAGMACLSLGIWLTARLGAAAPAWSIPARLAVVGAGSGLFTAPNNSAIMAAAPHRHRGVAAGLLALARNLGMMAGVAAAGALFGFLQGSRLAAGADPTSAFLGAFHETLLEASGLAAAGALLSFLRPAPGQHPGT